MFYSHEILTSRQYGVSTIWLVATVGNGVTTGKRVTKKAIQAVDLQKACGKIIEPGAPVALRLQGHLLYGVSRVFSEQCRYMLSDLQKIQMNMHFFFTRYGENQLDPEAGQARPENLLISNDPDFVPDGQLPKFDLDALVASSQATNKTSSQMSPLDKTLLSASDSSGHGFDLRLDLGRSDSPGPPPGYPSGFQGLSSSQKPGSAHLILNEDDEFAGAGDWGMDIDEDGNIIEAAEPAMVQDDFDLPHLPAMEDEVQRNVSLEQQHRPNVDDQGDVIMGEAQPEAVEVFSEHQSRDNHNAFLSDDQQHQRQQAPSRRRRKPRTVQVDEETQISRSTMSGWQGNYLENCCTRKARPTGPTQAKANAMLLTFGLGLANIGQNLGVPGMVHALALDFSGDSLFTAFTGLEVHELSHGRRRSASESIEDNEDHNARRVRPRLEGDEDEQGRGLDGFDVFGQEAQVVHDSPEVGREPQAPMSDHLSSALRMPWNRGSSLIPGSSIRGSAQKGRIPTSPSGGHGSIKDLVRFSDAPSFGDDGFDFAAGLRSDDDPFDGFQLAEGAEGDTQKKGGWPMLDIEGQNFLSFMGSAIRENGERRQDEDFDVDRRWVAFEDVFVPRETPRATAAHAFYHALCLANKGNMELEQDGEPNVPFGSVWVGLKMAEIDPPAASAA